MDLTFTPAVPQDVEPIFALSKDLIDTYEEIENIDYRRVLAWVHQKIQQNIREYTCIFLDGEKVGYCRFCPKVDRMELDDLYILPPYRNRGIGTTVIQKYLAETDRPVMLYVFIRNTGAVSLYRRLGFRVTETIGTSRYIMQKD